MLEIEKSNTTKKLTSSHSLLDVAEKSIKDLEETYKNKLIVNGDLDRKLVSFQANKAEAIYRWFKYREGFSRPLVDYLLKDANAEEKHDLLDPFAGTGAACFAACNLGLNSIALELLPVGAHFIKTRKLLGSVCFRKISKFVEKIKSEAEWKRVKPDIQFNHIRITQGAFSDDTEKKLSSYRTWSKSLKEPYRSIADLISFSILEEISFTRKDGQYLRWDHRAPREGLRSKFNKGTIVPFEEAVAKKCDQIIDDLSVNPDSKFDEGSISPELIEGQNFTTINEVNDLSVDVVITSPPYCNRYDYTRTYALELAYLDYGEEQVKNLRQAMHTCTVENRPKELQKLVGTEITDEAIAVFKSSKALKATLDYLKEQKDLGNLNNNGIYSMVHGYFLEMAIHIRQISDKIRSGGKYYMVNDNVKYAGLDVPVDCILTEFAEDLGFKCDKIWVLPKGKGNSSQQMGRHGRTELRKCIYVWEKI